MRIFLTALLTLSTFAFCLGQTKNPAKSFKANELTFRSIFGFPPIDSTNVFILLGTGFVRTQRSYNSDSLINAWIENHPNAKVIPVTSTGPAMIANRKSKMTYCWVVDKRDTINNYLIRNGAFPAETMQRPPTWEEMTKAEKNIYQEKEKPKVTVYVDKKAYAKFLLQVKSAEAFARKNKLGIWKEDQ